MQRVTMKDLETICDRINKLTNSPMEAYTRKADGKFTANVGNYHLDGAYGGWKLVRMGNPGGGISDVLHSGFVSKRELYHLMHAFINGLEAQQSA